MSVRYEEYKGHKILFIDFSGLRDKQYLDAIDEAENEILKHKAGTISTITNVIDTFTTEEIKKRFAEMSEKTKGITLSRATIGVTGTKKIIARIIRKDIYFASSEMDAKEWIIKNVEPEP